MAETNILMLMIQLPQPKGLELVYPDIYGHYFGVGGNIVTAGQNRVCVLFKRATLALFTSVGKDCVAGSPILP
jgi:hypothetical protein